MKTRYVALACASWLNLGTAAAQPAGVATPPAGADPTEQQRLRALSPGGPVTDGVTLPDWPAPADPLDASTPVTDALLAEPPPDDWLTWRRTWDGDGFSPLGQIDGYS